MHLSFRQPSYVASIPFFSSSLADRLFILELIVIQVNGFIFSYIVVQYIMIGRQKRVKNEGLDRRRETGEHGLLRLRRWSIHSSIFCKDSVVELV